MAQIPSVLSDCNKTMMLGRNCGKRARAALGASFLIFIYILPLFLIQLGMRWGYYVGFLPSIMAIGNGIARISGVIKDKNFEGPKALSIINGVFLTITGIWVILSILSAL